MRNGASLPCMLLCCCCQATRMNTLLVELKRSMEELQLGLDGALNMSDKMEALARGIATNTVSRQSAAVPLAGKRNSCLVRHACDMPCHQQCVPTSLGKVCTGERRW